MTDLHLGFAYVAPAAPRELDEWTVWLETVRDYEEERQAYLDAVDKYLRKAGYSG